MPYSIVQPPFTLRFRDMPKRELEAYGEWFHSVMPERIQQLRALVRETPTFKGWEADMTPDSLGPLGAWFLEHVETRTRTTEEIAEVTSRLAFPMDVPEEELTNRSFSLAMDIGMYLGGVVLRSLPGTTWAQPLKNKDFADYGQPVILGFGSIPLNPVRIAVTLAYAFAAKEQPGTRLRALFDWWAARRAPPR